MVSARANEYITRFTTKGVQKKTVLKKIVEYRDECKGLYHEADAKMPRNYPAEVAKKEYLSDMIKRIECLAEARDYLQDQIDNKAPTKANNMYSAVAFVPEKETKPTKTTYFQRTESDLRKIGIKDANVVKYILRFQGAGLSNNSAGDCTNAAGDYQEEWIRNKASDPNDYSYCERADVAIEALDTTMEYFSELQETINSESKPTKKPTNKHYKRIESETSWENFDRMMGRT